MTLLSEMIMDAGEHRRAFPSFSPASLESNEVPVFCLKEL